jgi:aspartate aminotransferase/aminotransferase
VISSEEMEMVAELAKQHDLLVISDEIYELFQYDEEPVSIAEIYPKTLILNGFSKFAAMTGWRVGYALGPKDLIAAMAEVQQYSFVCAPSFAQKAALAALDVDMSEYVNAYRKKRDRIYEGLKDRFDIQPSGGAFYAFPGTKSGDGDAFVAEAIKEGVLVVPGSVFSEKNTHFRISFAATGETIEKGIEKLNKLAERFSG